MRGHFEGSPRWAGSILVIIILAGSISCAGEARQRANDQQVQTYEATLQQKVRSYVYPMGCRAVMPVANDVLYDQGYRIHAEEQDHYQLRTRWKGEETETPSRYLVQGFPLADQQCNVQFLREVKGDRSQSHRDLTLELELLKRLAPEVARSFQNQAETAGKAAFKETLNRD
ncbi:MAG: hypothetical protein ACNA8W_13650 [Bradymonadaceae bacterium]